MGAIKEVFEVIEQPATFQGIANLVDRSLSSVALKHPAKAEAAASQDLLLEQFKRAQIATGDGVAALSTQAIALGHAGKPGMLANILINPEELVATSQKVIGHSRFNISEGTRKLLVQPVVDSTTEPVPKPFSMADVRRLVDDATEPKSKRIIGDDGTRLKLSAAGRLVYQSSHDIRTYVEAISQGVKDGRWSNIIADDVSGRLPGLITHDQLQRFSAHRSTTPPQLLFMASGRNGVGEDYSFNARVSNLAQRMEEEGSDLKKGRTLIVTEIIASGDSIAQFLRAMERHDIQYDVASMDGGYLDRLRTRHKMRMDANLFRGDGEGEFYTQGAGSENILRQAIGVEKYGNEATSRKQIKNPEAVAKLRDEVNRLSQLTFERVFQ